MNQAHQRQRVDRCQPTSRLTSRLLPAQASEFTNAKFAKSLGFSPMQPLGFLEGVMNSRQLIDCYR
jgi:hypothetical protein